jgi:hypothetical protein
VRGVCVEFVVWQVELDIISGPVVQHMTVLHAEALVWSNTLVSTCMVAVLCAGAAWKRRGCIGQVQRPVGATRSCAADAAATAGLPIASS